jgi:hypothetical protein
VTLLLTSGELSSVAASNSGSSVWPMPIGSFSFPKSVVPLSRSGAVEEPQDEQKRAFEETGLPQAGQNMERAFYQSNSGKTTARSRSAGRRPLSAMECWQVSIFINGGVRVYFCSRVARGSAGHRVNEPSGRLRSLDLMTTMSHNFLSQCERGQRI